MKGCLPYIIAIYIVVAASGEFRCQPVRRAGSEKVLATRHLFEKTRQKSQVESRVFLWKRGFGPLLAYLRLPGRILDQYLDESIPAWEFLVQSPQTASETDH